MMKVWQIAELKETKKKTFETFTVSMVAEKWIQRKGNEVFCLWPNTFAATKIEEAADPKQGDGWKLYPCRILMNGAKYTKYEEALEAEQMCMNVSTVSEYERFKRRSDNKGSLPRKKSKSCVAYTDLLTYFQPLKLTENDSEMDSSSENSFISGNDSFEFNKGMLFKCNWSDKSGEGSSQVIDAEKIDIFEEEEEEERKSKGKTFSSLHGNEPFLEKGYSEFKSQITNLLTSSAISEQNEPEKATVSRNNILTRVENLQNILCKFTNAVQHELDELKNSLACSTFDPLDRTKDVLLIEENEMDATITTNLKPTFEDIIEVLPLQKHTDTVPFKKSMRKMNTTFMIPNEENPALDNDEVTVQFKKNLNLVVPLQSATSSTFNRPDGSALVQENDDPVIGSIAPSILKEPEALVAPIGSGLIAQAIREPEALVEENIGPVGGELVPPIFNAPHALVDGNEGPVGGGGLILPILNAPQDLVQGNLGPVGGGLVLPILNPPQAFVAGNQGPVGGGLVLPILNDPQAFVAGNQGVGGDLVLPILNVPHFKQVEDILYSEQYANAFKQITQPNQNEVEARYMDRIYHLLFEDNFFLDFVSWRKVQKLVDLKGTNIVYLWKESFETKFSNPSTANFQSHCRRLKSAMRAALKGKKTPT